MKKYKIMLKFSDDVIIDCYFFYIEDDYLYLQDGQDEQIAVFKDWLYIIPYEEKK